MTQDDANVMILFILFGIIWSVFRNAIHDQSSNSFDPGRSPASLGFPYNQHVVDLRLGEGRSPSSSTDRSDADVARDLELIRQFDPAFDARQFLDSGCLVYETVVMAFANGDRELLHDLVSVDIYNTFSEIILKREERCERVELSFVCLESAEITNVSLFNKCAQITICFVAQLITATHAENGAVVAGDPEKILNVNDMWTFARELTSKRPAWKLVRTDSV